MIKNILSLVLVLTVGFGATAQSKKKETLVLISTELGDIKLKLYNETPQHRDNFI